MTDHVIALDNGDNSVIISVVLLVLQSELLSSKWSPNVVVNVVSANSAYETVRAGHAALASLEFLHAWCGGCVGGCGLTLGT